MEGFIRKTSEVPIPAFEVSKREVHAYVSIFGNLDSVGDIVERGAFAESITGPGNRVAKGLVPVKHNHERIVGKTLHAEEDSRGLLTVQRFHTDPESDRIFGMVRDGIIPTFSFKARIPKGGQTRKKTADGTAYNALSKMVLLEAGPADPDLAVNDSTFVVATKAQNFRELFDAEEDWLAKALELMSDEDKAAMREALAIKADILDVSDAVAQKAIAAFESIERQKVERLVGRLVQFTASRAAA